MPGRELNVSGRAVRKTHVKVVNWNFALWILGLLPNAVGSEGEDSSLIQDRGSPINAKQKVVVHFVASEKKVNSHQVTTPHTGGEI